MNRRFQVLMMGGNRCGKTSVLTSMFYQAINGDLNNIFTSSNVTPIHREDNEVIGLLENKRLELQNFIMKGGNHIFLADRNPGRNIWYYTLRLQLPGTGRHMEIIFRDCPGTLFYPESPLSDNAMDYMRECDVFIVVVDTPYLMAGTDYEKEAANIKDSIHTFLTNMNRNEVVQVIFVPVKCERWMKEGKIDRVTQAVEELYASTIRDLLATEEIEVSIIPVETAGDIVFEELRKSYVLCNNETGRQERCSLVEMNDTIVRLANGKIHQLRDSESVLEDMTSFFPFTSIERRNAWYSLWHNPKATYSPHNCEQLLIHILRFIYKKYIPKQLRYIMPPISPFGGITIEEMKYILRELSRTGLIKDSGDGIKILKSYKCDFKI